MNKREVRGKNQFQDSCPVDAQRRFDVITMLFDRYGRWIDVKATSCACWVAY